MRVEELCLDWLLGEGLPVAESGIEDEVDEFLRYLLTKVVLDIG